MKVLVLFEYANHYQTIDNLCNHLNKRGVEASSFNIVYWRFQKGKLRQRAIWIGLLSVLARVPGLRGLINKQFRYKALLKLSEAYDIIDIHFFSPAYDRLIEELGRRGKQVKITIWGSDFYMADSVRREQQRSIFQTVKTIQVETGEIAKDFLEHYPELESKVRIAHFGIVQLELIDQLQQQGGQEACKKELEIPEDRLVLTCGTNRSKGHRHLLMLESIERLAPDLREKLFLILPMTYGGDKAYIPEVRQKAEALGIPFRILSSFLTLEDLCRYRIVSDLTLTIQVSDALASAIQEHIYTGEILIAGDWLPYQVLKDEHVFFVTTSLESLDGVLTDVLKNYDSFREKCLGNRERISAFSAWDHVIEDWLSIYRETEV